MCSLFCAWWFFKFALIVINNYLMRFLSVANDKTLGSEHNVIIFENLSKASFYFYQGSDRISSHRSFLSVLAFFVHLKFKVAAIMLSLVS